MYVHSDVRMQTTALHGYNFPAISNERSQKVEFTLVFTPYADEYFETLFEKFLMQDPS